VMIIGKQPIGGNIDTPIFLAPSAYKSCHMHDKKFKAKSSTKIYMFFYDEKNYFNGGKEFNFFHIIIFNIIIHIFIIHL